MLVSFSTMGPDSFIAMNYIAIFSHLWTLSAVSCDWGQTDPLHYVTT